MKILKPETAAEMQLQKEIIEDCREKIKYQSKRRKEIKHKNEWDSMKESLVEHIRSSFHPLVFNKSNPLNSRLVSQQDFAEYRIQNVLFESMPGWEVNGTVYLPKEPGRYPGVVCPTGHSSKTEISYQTSAQVFTRNGYIAISFDPPGCVGEIAYMNDHFSNGLVGYLTGIWSNVHFVIDAIRCIDYFESREDIDIDAGITITGVSGGGCTSIYASILDERIKFLAPVCCLAEHESIHFTDLYTSCPEQFGPGFIEKGIDYVDLLAIQAPKPCLIVGGQQDEVFDYKSTKRLYGEIEEIYKLYEAENNLGLYIQEDSGHAYTVEMANKVVYWMNRIIKKQDIEPHEIKEEDIQVQPAHLLKCNPSNAVNMFTINRDEGERLKESRAYPQGRKNIEYLKQNTKEVLGLEKEQEFSLNVSEEENPPIRWAHQLQKIDIEVKDGVHIPGLLYKRVISSFDRSDNKKRPAMLFIDEAGKWKGFHHGGYLARVGRFLEREDMKSEPLIFSIDVSGLGELEPQPTAYDMAPWNDIERILTYLSIAGGKPIMGLRVRDALCALEYLKNRQDIDRDRIIIAGKGIGAIVALHTALFAGKIQKLVLWEMLLSYQSMTQLFPFHWRESIIIPGILKYYDLQDIVAAVQSQEKLLINPLNAQKKVVSLNEVKKFYDSNVRVFTEMEEDGASQIFVDGILTAAFTRGSNYGENNDKAL